MAVFPTEQHLDVHKRLCQPTEAQREDFPYNDRILKFVYVKKQLKVPFVANADFDCILKSRGDINTTTGIASDDSESATYQEHVPCSFGYKIVSIDPDFSSGIVVHFGEGAVIKFIDDLQMKAKEIFDQYIETPKAMLPLTPEEQWNVNCRICDKQLGEDRVRDHCHITGKFRYPLHNECNLNYNINPESWKLPGMMHILKGYDGHLIVQDMEELESLHRTWRNT